MAPENSVRVTQSASTKLAALNFLRPSIPCFGGTRRLKSVSSFCPTSLTALDPQISSMARMDLEFHPRFQTADGSPAAGRCRSFMWGRLGHSRVWRSNCRSAAILWSSSCIGYIKGRSLVELRSRNNQAIITLFLTALAVITTVVQDV